MGKSKGPIYQPNNFLSRTKPRTLTLHSNTGQLVFIPITKLQVDKDFIYSRRRNWFMKSIHYVFMGIDYKTHNKINEDF